MVEQNYSEIISVVLASALLLHLLEEFIDSLLHFLPVTSDVRKQTCLYFATLHAHLTLTLIETLDNLALNLLISPVEDKEESLL
jgi:hypothetical protein